MLDIFPFLWYNTLKIIKQKRETMFAILFKIAFIIALMFFACYLLLDIFNVEESKFITWGLFISFMMVAMSFIFPVVGSNACNPSSDIASFICLVGLVKLTKPAFKLVAAVLATANRTTADDRIELFQAIERFNFLSFRVGGFNASYKSSDYYNKARGILRGSIALSSVAEDLTETVNKDITAIIANFMTRTDRRFDSGEGFYGWRDLRYFLYEYECELVSHGTKLYMSKLLLL